MKSSGYSMTEADEAKREAERIFKRMLRQMPACLWGALDNPTKLSDLQFAAQHEIDCFEEDQDGHLTEAEIKLVRKFIRKVGGYL